MARSYAVPSVPVPNMVDDADVAEYLSTDPHVSTSYLRREIVQGNGTGANLLVVDIAPGGESQMHRTVSLDFSVCVAGRIWCELDSGERVELGPGVSLGFLFSLLEFWRGLWNGEGGGKGCRTVLPSFPAGEILFKFDADCGCRCRTMSSSVARCTSGSMPRPRSRRGSWA